MSNDNFPNALIYTNYIAFTPATGIDAVTADKDVKIQFFDGGTTFATAIANAAQEFNNNIQAGAYISAGLVLFLLTFVVNAIARAIVAKR